MVFVWRSRESWAGCWCEALTKSTKDHGFVVELSAGGGTRFTALSRHQSLESAGRVRWVWSGSEGFSTTWESLGSRSCRTPLRPPFCLTVESLLADLTVDCRAAPALTSFNRILHTELYLKVGFNLESDSQAARRRTGEQGSRWNSRSCGRNRKS